jgi:uncharacterized protein (TIGR02270 family)
MPSAPTAIIKDIVEHYFEEASFLWTQRDVAAKSTHYTLKDLVYLDGRLEAQIDGLRVAGEFGWEECEGGLNPEDSGTVFATSVMALESEDQEKIKAVIDISGKSRSGFRAVLSGLGWIDGKNFASVIKNLVRNKSRRHRRLGIAACGIRRVDPKSFLNQALNSSDLYLKARALRTVGELKRHDLLPMVQSELQNENHMCRFEAARTALLLGDQPALKILKPFIQTPSAFRLPAMEIVLRILDSQTSQVLLKAIAKDRGQLRDVLIGIGIAGDPVYIPMLLQQMESPEMARAAAESFSMITGVDLVDEGLEGTLPDGFEAGPNDDPEDEDVEMDPDENSPWPETSLVKKWWEQNHSNLSAGVRYLAGSPISPEQCVQILDTGSQRHRQAAALELALGQADAPYVNTRSPGHSQK